MCNPSAIGSRQARSTIWARWRGGNLLRTPDPGVVQQEFFQAALLVTTADPPDGGPITLHPRGDALNRFAGGNGQHDAGMLDLKPGQAAAAGDRLEDGGIRVSNGERTRLTSTHGATSEARAEGYHQHTR